MQAGLSCEGDLGLLLASVMSPGSLGPCFSLPLWPSYHFNLPHTTQVAAVFLSSSLSSQNTPGSAQSLSFLLSPPVNRAQPWSTSVGLARARSCKKPCPLGTLQRGCLSRLLAPRLLMVRAFGLYLTSHASLRPSAAGPTPPHSFWLQAFFWASRQPRPQKSPLKVPSPASS